MKQGANGKTILKLARVGLLVTIPLLWCFLVAMLGLSRYDFLLGRAKSATIHIQNIQTIAKEIDVKQDLGKPDNLRATLSRVRGELNATQTDFNAIAADLTRLRIPLSIAKITPLAPTIDTARFLVDAGDDFLQAGQEGLNIADIGIEVLSKLGSKSSDTSGSNLSGFGVELDQKTLQELKQKVARTNQLVNSGVKQFNQIPLDKLNPGSELYKAVSELQRQLPNLSKVLGEGERGLATIEALLGYGESPATFLVVIQDASETRPTGGFIGNYAVVNVQYGKLGNYYFDNVYKLDDAYRQKSGNYTKAPEAYISWWFLPFDWGLRDVNITPDFPEVARYAQELALKRGAADKFDAVMAINPNFVLEILRLTGPIKVFEAGEFDDTITAENLVTKLHFYQLQAEQFDGSKFYQRKRFTKLFAEGLISKLKSLPKDQFVKVAEIALNALETKDILIYANDGFAQKWLESQGWAGSIERESITEIGTPRDYFMVADTSMSGNKVNSYIEQSAQDNISFNADGTTKHNLTLTYNYTGKPTVYEAGSNGGALISYNRLYLPRNSQMLQRLDFAHIDSPIEQYEKWVWGQLLVVVQTAKYQPKVEWLSPPEASGLGRDRNGRLTYNLLVQRQPATELKYELKLKPPTGYRVAAVSANDMLIAPSAPDANGAVTVFNSMITRDTALIVYFDPLR